MPTPLLADSLGICILGFWDFRLDQHQLAEPAWLLVLALIPLVLWLRGRRAQPVLVVPFAAAWHRPSPVSPSRLPVVLAVLGLILLSLALARPQRIDQRLPVNARGYDLMLAIDLSGSMLAEDFERDGRRINRLQAIQPVIEAFIQRRPGDRIGVVLFAGRAYTLAPLTFDHVWLGKQIERLRIGLIEDGTAIGDGIGVALSRLEQSDRVTDGRRAGAFIILLTDGANNRGALSPEQAAKLAKSRGIPVYTIGAGRDGLVPMPVFDREGRRLGTRNVPSDLDEPTLRFIAAETGGAYFRADRADTAEAAFRAIDQTAKLDFDTQAQLVTAELFPWFAGPGAAFLLFGGLLLRRP